MKSDKVQSLFPKKLETCAPVKGQPSVLDLFSLREILTTLLLPIGYDGKKGIHNLFGLIMNEDAYRARHGSKFLTPSCLAIYNVDIPIDASNAVRVCREAAHTAKKEDYRLFTAAKRESSKFILAIVEDAHTSQALPRIATVSCLTSWQARLEHNLAILKSCYS